VTLPSDSVVDVQCGSGAFLAEAVLVSLRSQLQTARATYFALVDQRARLEELHMQRDIVFELANAIHEATGVWE
jgi:hypothetical protein